MFVCFLVAKWLDVGGAGRSVAGVGRVDLRAGASASQPVGSGVARIDSIARRVDVVSGVGRGVGRPPKKVANGGKGQKVV